MTRTVKDPDVRSNEILDAAQRLFFIQGYEHTSVQQIIDEVDIAKGTFYHYYRSKIDLLDALFQRMFEGTLQVLTPMVADASLSSLEKFDRFFAQIGTWKFENKAFLTDLLETYYGDENALFREKLNKTSIRMTAPLFAQIIRQGIQEGIFAANDPEVLAEIVIGIWQQLPDAFAHLVLDGVVDEDALASLQEKVDAYQAATDRVLGAQPGTVQFFDMQAVRAWFQSGV
ncbi:MAG: TetR/AcrR family transcriptional regulator [Anaerolineales bacterium]|jgi:AcrR family transcriptional regulator